MAAVDNVLDILRNRLGDGSTEVAMANIEKSKIFGLQNNYK